MTTSIDTLLTEAQHAAEHALIEWDEPYTEQNEEFVEDLVETIGEDAALFGDCSTTKIYGVSPVRNFTIQIERLLDTEVIIMRDTGESFAENYEVATFSDHNDPQIEVAIEEAKALCAERLVWELHNDQELNTPPEHLDF